MAIPSAFLLEMVVIVFRGYDYTFRCSDTLRGGYLELGGGDWNEVDWSKAEGNGRTATAILAQ